MSSDAPPIVSWALAGRALARGSAAGGLAWVGALALRAGWRATIVGVTFAAAAVACGVVVERLAVVRGRRPASTAALAACGASAVYLVAAVNAGWCFVGPTRALELLAAGLRRGPGQGGTELLAVVGIVTLYFASAHVLNALAERARDHTARPVVDGAALREHPGVLQALATANLLVAQALGLVTALDSQPGDAVVAMVAWAACTVAWFVVGLVFALAIHVTCLQLDRLAWRLSPAD